MFGLAYAEFDVGIHLDHSGSNDGCNESNHGGTAISHERFGFSSEVVVEKPENAGRQKEGEGPYTGNDFKVRPEGDEAEGDKGVTAQESIDAVGVVDGIDGELEKEQH